MDQKQQQIVQTNQQNNSDCQSFQSNLLQFDSTQLSFPQLPPQLDTIYNIYIQGQQKMYKLRQKVQQLQIQILQMQRARDDSKSLQDQGVILLEQDIQDDNDFMIEYQKECNKRASQLNQLDEIYIKMKRIYTQQSILNNQKLKDNIIKHIRANREVIQYKVVNQFIIMLYKYMKYQVVPQPQKIISNHQLYHNNNNNLLNILNRSLKSQTHSNRKGHRSQDLRNQPVKITSFGVKIINFQNMFNKFRYKSIQQHELNEEVMMKVKQQAQKQVNSAINIEIKTKNEYKSISYNPKRQQLYLIDNKNNISSIKMDGSQSLLNISIDKNQQTKLFRSLNDKLYIGSNKGILRQYIYQQNTLTINKLYGCFNIQRQEIDNYILIDHNDSLRIIFNIGIYIYQINLITYEITQIIKLSTKMLYQINNYIITEDKIYRAVIKQSKNGYIIDKICINSMQSLNLWYKQQKQLELKRIVHIDQLQIKSFSVLDKKQIEKDRYYIIFADLSGNFQQIYT